MRGDMMLPISSLQEKLREILHTQYAHELAKVHELDVVVREAEPQFRPILCEDLVTLYDLVPLNKSYICPHTIPASTDDIKAAASIVEDEVRKGSVSPDSIFILSQTPEEAGVRLARELDFMGKDMKLARTMYLLAILRSNHVPFLKHIEVREHITTGIEILIELSKEDVRSLQESFVVLMSPHPLPAIAEWILSIPNRVNDPAKAKVLALALIQRLVAGVSVGVEEKFKEEIEMYKTALLSQGTNPAGSC